MAYLCHRIFCVYVRQLWAFHCDQLARIKDDSGACQTFPKVFEDFGQIMYMARKLVNDLK